MTTAGEFTAKAVEDMVRADCGYWALLNKIRLGAGEFTFVDHEYQQAWFDCEAKRRCCMKATQAGFTECEVLRSLHGLIHGRYPLGVLHLMPTADDVGEYSKARFNPLIQANPLAIGRFVKTGGKGTDTASLKQIGRAFLYLRGARLTQLVGGAGDEKESTKLRSIPVDCCKFDECSLMDDEVFARARGRMGASKIQEEVYYANPLLPDSDIDALFHQSDQRWLNYRCEACNTWTDIVRAFPACVKDYKDGRGYCACTKCGKPIDLHGKQAYVPDVPANAQVMVGFQWSQLSSAFNDPMDILRAFQNPPEGGIDNVYRLKLGLPHVQAKDRLIPSAVLACCGCDVTQASHGGPCAMGVDVGETWHVVIGCRTGNDQYEIVKIEEAESWEEIHRLIRLFNVKSAVIDIFPLMDGARQFQKAEGRFIWLSEYDENSVLGTRWHDDLGIVKVNRNEILDAGHRAIQDKTIVLPRPCKEVEDFAKQCCNTAKVLTVDKRSGTSIYRYRKLGADHYRHAFGYFLLAASGARIASVRRGRDRPTSVISDYAVI